MISPLSADSRRILHAVRAHWCLDVTFGEDASPIRLRNAAFNFSFLHRLAIDLFRADRSRSASLPKKRKTAAWNPDYLVTILRLREFDASVLPTNDRQARQSMNKCYAESQW